MWYLIHCQSENSYCIVDKKAVLSAGDSKELKVDDLVSFTYARKNKPYLGKIVAMSGNWDDMDALLKEKGVKARGSKPPTKDVKPSDVLGKRRAAPPVKFGTNVVHLPVPSKKPKQTVTEEEASRKRIRELNLKTAENRASTAILKDIEKGNKLDPDYELSGSGSEDEFLQELNASNVKRKKEREVLMKGIRHLDNIESEDVEPKEKELTIDDYKKMLDDYKMKLQMAYEERDQKDSWKETDGGLQDISEKEDVAETEAVHSREDQDDHQHLKDDDEVENNKSLDDDLESSRKSTTEDDVVDMSCNELNHQLYGKDQKDSVLLHGSIYIKAKNLSDAMNNSSQISHMVRRLMPGVFVAKELLNCTYTGRRPTALGKDNAPAEPEALHPKAIETIIKFARSYGKTDGRKWPNVRTKALTPIISQKLGEMKREYRKKHPAEAPK